MTGPRLTDRTQAGVAFLDDARKRRKRRRAQAEAPATPVIVGEPYGPELGAEDSSGYATDLADGLLDEQPETPAGGADAILAQHEAAADALASRPAPGERVDDAPADEVLLALEGHHQRAEPRQRQLAPRGSADLDANQAQRPRAKPTTKRPAFKRPRPSRRLLAGGAVAAAIVAIVMASNGSSSPSKAENRLAPVATSTGTTALAAGNFPSHGLFAVRPTHQRARKPAPKHHPPKASHTTTNVAPSSSATISSAPPINRSTPTATAASSASTEQQAANSNPAPAQSAQTAGPSGNGAMLGPGHCGC